MSEDGGGDGGLIGACIRGDVARARSILAASPTEVHRLETRLGISPLHFAAHRGYREIVSLLVDSGADVSVAETASGATALHWAAEGGHAEVAMLLLDAGARHDVRDRFFDLEPLAWGSAVIYAPRFQRDRPGTARRLLARGARLDPFTAVALDCFGETRPEPRWVRETMGPAGDREGPLHFAVRDDSPRGITALRGAGADPAALSARGVTPRALALHLGRDRCIPALPETTGDPSWHVASGDAAGLDASLASAPPLPGGPLAHLIHFAAEGHAAAIPVLLRHGADPEGIWIALEGEELVGLRPLHVAARAGEPDVVAALVAGGARVDQRISGGGGATALHLAAARGDGAVVEALLQAGADRAAGDGEEGATPADWARDHGHADLALRLL